jgi:hypothetical protein
MKVIKSQFHTRSASVRDAQPKGSKWLGLEKTKTHIMNKNPKLDMPGKGRNPMATATPDEKKRRFFGTGVFFVKRGTIVLPGVP